MTTPHRLLVRAEAKIHHNLFTLAQLAGKSLEMAMESLKTQDADKANEVVANDAQQNNLHRIIEHECLQVLATLEPKANDLREVIASLQIAGELERIGDHAKSIANIVLGMDPSDFSGPMDRLSDMGDLCQTMLTQSMEAYGNLDIGLAEAAAACDQQMDELDEAASSSLMMTIMTSIDATMHTTHLLWIAYHLERIGDRVTNIAERVVFMVTAETPELNQDNS